VDVAGRTRRRRHADSVAVHPDGATKHLVEVDDGDLEAARLALSTSTIFVYAFATDSIDDVVHRFSDDG
jgi:hypothetical protein